MRHVPNNRRSFLSNIGHGMLIAGIGYSAARALELTPAWAEDAGPERLSFGSHERLVGLMQETPADRLLPQLVQMHRAGTDLRDLISAAALANTRAFGGEDYVGFHTFMALMPAYRMAQALPSERAALPVLKVVYRNSLRLQETGHSTEDTLHPVAAATPPPVSPLTTAIREAIHRGDKAAAEQALAAAAGVSAETAWSDLLPTVQEAPEVHRIVLAHRAWDMLNLVGAEHAETMLRQSVRYCIRGEQPRTKHFGHVPDLLTQTLEQHKLLARKPGKRKADDAWIEAMVGTLFTSSPEQAADAVGAALAEGISAASVCEAVCLTANQLVLRDRGRRPAEAQPNKPEGSTHGDSIGVHASDSANAWRHVAAASNARNATASLVLAGWQVAHDRVVRGGDFQQWPPHPLPEHLEAVTTEEPSRLLAEMDGAIREQNQEGVCAVVHRYLELGHPAKPVFDTMLRYATSEDGALHAEKYFWTVSDEFMQTRPAFRNRQLVALARVTASQYGTPAPGYEEACELMGCEV